MIVPTLGGLLLGGYFLVYLIRKGSYNNHRPPVPDRWPELPPLPADTDPHGAPEDRGNAR
ncbi:MULTISPECIES: hypothetical protein [Rhodococcus]|jgi:hypothetical protein|uniref:hypothetical protein n=1 Tax=Rhodococcus TaxID=1827 RepID=UPI000815AE67|nr:MULTISPECIES: hypothetical protein [Rhodococcus]NHP18222.1 hypothetical protein [Rhodococcus sp. IC4_135]SCC70386.1 hypothetical protein GA0061093_14116 [Rhodococcus qingshengii]